MLMRGGFLTVECTDKTAEMSGWGIRCGSRWVSVTEAARRLGVSRYRVSSGVGRDEIPNWHGYDGIRYVSLDWLEGIERTRDARQEEAR